jgi:large-conductance mechanosensitive channel
MIDYTWAVLAFVVGSAFGGIVIALAIGLIKPPARWARRTQGRVLTSPRCGCAGV